jgi:hypothetical protein
VKLTKSQLKQIISGLNYSAMAKESLFKEIVDRETDSIENHVVYELWANELVGGPEALLKVMSELSLPSSVDQPSLFLSALKPLLLTLEVSEDKIDKLIEVGSRNEQKLDQLLKKKRGTRK